MVIYIINGSPRKKHNTAAMISSFADGVKATDGSIEVKVINLYDLSFTGCKSCFGCKLPRTYGACAAKDDLHNLLPSLFQADGIVLASPVYFGDMTGEMKCFLERFVFPNFTYEKGYRSIAPKRMPIQMIYTMNVTREQYDMMGYEQHLLYTENFIGMTYTQPKRLCAFNTYQLNDYSRYRIEAFSEADKAEYRRRQFPKDREAAYKAGVEMAQALRQG